MRAVLRQWELRQRAHQDSDTFKLRSNIDNLSMSMTFPTVNMSNSNSGETEFVMLTLRNPDLRTAFRLF